MGFAFLSSMMMLLRLFGFFAAACDRKVDIRLPGKGNSNSHGARPVY